jgi:hypothetical protein
MGKHHLANVMDDKPIPPPEPPVEDVPGVKPMPPVVPEPVLPPGVKPVPPAPEPEPAPEPKAAAVRDPAKRHGKPKMPPRATRDEPLPKKGPKHYKPRRR